MGTVDGRLSIDVTGYFRLPPDVKVRFDGWLKSEGLIAERIVKLTLAEGEIIAERVATDAEGKLVLDDTGKNVVMETVRFPVESLPPADAFNLGEERTVTDGGEGSVTE